MDASAGNFDIDIEKHRLPRNIKQILPTPSLIDD